jgi:hypothetical protein
MTVEDLKAAKAKWKKVGWKGLADSDKKILLSNKRWRMNHLYYIRDKNGDKVLFKMNFAQRWLFKNIWYLNIILKARQMGFTTFIDLYILDECLFNKGVEAGIIAHNKDDASKIFRRKIKFPYDNLPADIKEAIYRTSNSKTEMEFSNGSVITVGVSFRSGTCQYLHISEFGKICAKYPDKAEEIKSGALEAVAAGQMVFIESTAEGRGGDFFDYCQLARKLLDEAIALTKMDYRFHFFPWWQEPEYVLPQPEQVLITAEMKQYFDDLLRQHGIELTDAQKAWYVKKEEKQGDSMKREYPSTPDEAFEAALKGAYWSKLISFIRQKRQITNVPHDPALQVHTAWDLGRRDTNPIWFFQHYGNQFRIINFYQNSGESLAHYAGVLRQYYEKFDYVYGNHYLPHDVAVTDISADNSRQVILENLGVKPIILVKRETDLDAMQGVDAVRRILPMCWFDKEKCDELGIAALEAYQKEWDDKNATFKNRPLHNWASHAGSAFKILAQGFEPMIQYSQSNVQPDDEASY